MLKQSILMRIREILLVSLPVILTLFPINVPAESGGKEVFESRCAMCHELPDPNKLSSEQWVLKLEEMAPNAGLNTRQQSNVLAYLQTHSREAGQIVSMDKERKLFEEKCSLCHTTQRIFLIPLNQESRRHIIQRMQERAAGMISEQEAHEILEFLNRGAPGIDKPVRHEVEGRPVAIFRERCTACHSAERVYSKLQQSEGKGRASNWLHIVNRMRGKAPDWISEEEAEAILGFLASLQPAKGHPLPETQ